MRWVLGESKASELRGESMQDVIFNGCGQRKPAGRASVELVFDNSAGARRRAVEPVRRDRRQARARRATAAPATTSTTSRCAGATCRTCSSAPAWGRAPTRSSARARSAASSRRKPEELRLFLEEAAGVSKYKERRRETENRLKDTRENLTRVEDILRELERQPRQAREAGRGGARSTARCRTQGTLKLHQLWFLKHRDAAERGGARRRRGGRGAPTRWRRALAELRARRGRAGDRAPGALRGRRRAARGAGLNWPRPRSR
ncbi:MAG: hypothetical protein MZW92_72905 [Comamonadaceae bacterium]|nr:hypothetical protein [Comamonadaceae bacterium]